MNFENMPQGQEEQNQKKKNCDPDCDLPSCDRPGCDLPGCDLPSCDLPCDCDFTSVKFLRLSTILIVLSTVLPGKFGTSFTLHSIHGYRRWLTRYTPVCPSTPSCSEYAQEQVSSHGAKYGLKAAANRLRRCSSGTIVSSTCPKCQ